MMNTNIENENTRSMKMKLMFSLVGKKQSLMVDEVSGEVSTTFGAGAGGGTSLERISRLG